MNTSGPHTPASIDRRRHLPLVLLALAAILFAIRPLLPAGNGLTGRYFESLDRSGRPRHTQQDRQPSTDAIRSAWFSGAPGSFSVEWGGYLTVPAPGVYQFDTTSDDGSELLIDGLLVVDNSGPHAAQTRTGQMRLTSGPHRVTLLFDNRAGGFEFAWRWAPAGTSPAAVPSWLLSSRPVRHADAVATRAAIWVAWAALVLAVILFIWTGRIDRLFWIAAIVLPLVLTVHAITFWGRGIIDQEATTFVINYLADRPLFDALFDPRLNDWGSFQARELSYVFDRLDARVFASLLDRHVFWLVPVSGIAGLIGVAVVFITGARRALALDRTTTGLLLSVFLSCIVTQASTPILYRSSKILLAVAMLAFFFRLVAVLDRDRPSLRNNAGLVALGVIMAMVDRQGYFYLLGATALMATLWLRHRLIAGIEPPGSIARPFGTLAIATGAGVAIAMLYNNVIAPQTILHLNGYWPDMSYEDVPFERFTGAVVASAWRMFHEQISYFFGNAPFALVLAGGAAIWYGSARYGAPRAQATGVLRFMPGDVFITTAAVAGALLTLITVMGMRHEPVFQIPDHSFWYYTLSMQAMLLLCTTLVVARVVPPTVPRWPVWVMLAAMVAGNAGHYGAQKTIMQNSGRWFGKQWAFAQLYRDDFAASEEGPLGDNRVLPSWARPIERGIEVRLPLDGTGLLDSVRLGYATLEHREPFAGAGGPYWSPLREFLASAVSPLAAPESAPLAVNALRAVGVRRIVVDRARFDRTEIADALVSAARQAGARAEGAPGNGPTVLEFPVATAVRLDTRRLHAIASAAVRLSASTAAGRLNLAVDGDISSEWNTGAPQRGGEWLRADLAAPHRVRVVRLSLGEERVDAFPRDLEVVATDDAGERTVFRGSPMPMLFRAILTSPAQTPIDIPLDDNHARTITIRQHGQAPSPWALRELTLFE